MQNKGKYNEDFSKAPTQNAGESAQAYGQRLKDWQRRRSMNGSKAPTAKPKPATTQKKPTGGAFGWADKVIDALK